MGLRLLWEVFDPGQPVYFGLCLGETQVISASSRPPGKRFIKTHSSHPGLNCFSVDFVLQKTSCAHVLPFILKPPLVQVRTGHGNQMEKRCFLPAGTGVFLENEFKKFIQWMETFIYAAGLTHACTYARTHTTVCDDCGASQHMCSDFLMHSPVTLKANVMVATEMGQIYIIPVEIVNVVKNKYINEAILHSVCKLLFARCVRGVELLLLLRTEQLCSREPEAPACTLD